MDWIAYLLFIAAVMIFLLTPGPVIMLVASAGMRGGYPKAFRTIVGTNLASLLLIFLSILVIKGLLNINAQWLSIIQLLGSAYIAFIGIQILIEGLEHRYNAIAPQSIRAQNIGGFKQGFLVAISNPKDIIFFASFFPQFIRVLPDINSSLSLITVTWIVLDFSILSVIYFVFQRLANSRYYHHILICCGLVLFLVAGYGVASALF
ncbi:LysE family translocator [Acinetobacter larvae]|uniref:Amino acid transporter n=1 Tax=Acinetobacter larvae TaxID=1789224 RepID=A0A1B2LXZ7_9GAMM|nr:LysE family translocator [Acinetobacter larvae]AOA57643.1 amino acid transporter [Acinetobacter larvae]